MAGITVGPERQDVILREGQVHFEMAIGAGVLVERRGVASHVAITANKGQAVHAGFMSRQYKAHAVVIEGGWTPGGGRVTVGALQAQRSCMGVVCRMARGAVCGRAFEDASNMAGGAFRGDVFAVQLKGELRMIHIAFPAIGGMAGDAVRSESAVVLVMRGMAGVTVGGRALIDAILVTAAARDGDVTAGQFEGGDIVIELRGLGPAFGCVTRATFRSETGLVEIVLLVTGIAILRRGHQVVEIARANVTTRAGGLCVQADERKGSFGVVEFMAVRIETVVTGQAVRPKGEDMFLREDRVHLQMAVGANILVEGGAITVHMAITALERRTVHSQAVRVEGIAELRVRIPTRPHLCQGGGGAVMIGVTGAAVEIGFAEFHEAVQALRVLQFGAHIGMARETAVCHAFAAPRRGVAIAALWYG